MTSVKITVVMLFILLKTGIAQIPTGYYNAAQGLTGDTLKLTLHNIIKNHTSVSYSSLWSHFQATDAKANGKVWDIYSDIPNGTPPYSFSFNTNQCGSYSVEGDCYNREHSWPQSWFNSAQVPSSDLFHIYPTDGKVNGERSNYPYGVVGVAAITTLNGSKLGTSATLDYSGTVFEPIDDYKGDLARGYFYMCTRYMGEDATWSVAAGQMTNKSEILPWGLALLLSWHHADTVSAKEINRNNAIYQIQHNRNPFIDNPQWADSIWATLVTSYKNNLNKNIQVTIQPNPANDNIIVNINNLQASYNTQLIIYNLYGQKVLEQPIANSLQSIDISKLLKGIYFLQIQNFTNVLVQKLVVE